MAGISGWLNQRLACNRQPFPCMHWKPFLFIALNLGLLAFLLFDGPVVAAAGQIPSQVRSLGRFLTDLGTSGWILIGAAILFFQSWAAARMMRCARERYHALVLAHISAYVFLAIALSGLSVNLLKRIVGRARPTNFEEWGTFGFFPLAGNSRFESFPSGHSTTIGALFMALALLAPGYRMPLAVMAVWMAMTRVMVGAHYPSDVIWGLAYGAWFALATAIVFSRYRLVFRCIPGGLPMPRHRLFGAGRISGPGLRAITIA
ncbi:phosphatase PAP2 family protein [Pseudomonas sp. R2.Fl]|nr:phosphatase PAP2 family protein [Pseudomonas sp. R2.Fl]